MTSFRSHVIGASLSYVLSFAFFLILGRHFNEVAENYIDGFASKRPISNLRGAGPGPLDMAAASLIMTFDPAPDAASQSTEVAQNADALGVTPVAFTDEAGPIEAAKPMQVATLDPGAGGVAPDSTAKSAYAIAGRPIAAWQSLSGVPEPGAWALMVVGVGVLGARLRGGRRLPTLA